MKGNIAVFLCVLFLLPSAFLSAEESGRSLFEIIAEEGAEDAIPKVERDMESRFAVYNRLFHFNPDLLPSPLRVRVFADKGAYDSYVYERLGFMAPGAVYFHYGRSALRELAICVDGSGEEAMLSHQAFIQFLRGFIPNPPTWLLEGLGIYFSSLRLNYLSLAEYEENLLPLEAAKSYGERLPSPAEILSALSTQDAAAKAINADSSSIDFRIASWAFVSFLLNGTRDYYRALTDSFLFLLPEASTEENTIAAFNRFSLQNNMEEMDRDFRNYIGTRKTFRELMEEGQGAYSRHDNMSAELSFLTAKNQRPSDYAPYYYLGLLSYDGKNYSLAERYYLDSMERGADAALVNFALGNNAAAAGRYSEAAEYLRKASAMDPPRYKARADSLLLRIGQR